MESSGRGAGPVGHPLQMGQALLGQRSDGQGFLLPVGNTSEVGKLRFLVYSRRKVKYAAPRNLQGLSASSAKGENMHVSV